MDVVNFLPRNLQNFLSSYTSNFHFHWPGILKEVLVDRCCMGCNGLTIRTVRTLEEEILAQVNNDTAPDMILPIYSDTLPAITLQYLPITSIKISALIGKIAQVKTEHLMTTLVYSAFKTWPLFLMAICMAICAGTFMWILVRSSKI